MIKAILISIASGLGLLILAGIWYNTRDIPQVKANAEKQQTYIEKLQSDVIDIRVQLGRHDQLFQDWSDTKSNCGNCHHKNNN